ncbi:hypothetical protein [Stigmatella aurantiaca]|uniref:Secreted protein n=1 Tax=Stigmatella aurantiaca (strain DW4/3-1) TaxID=378806 RepID=Q08S30_STIAD|nr:hypothetical protein [Stigmatella aurantiaca]ADO73132.1 uncharacterized protein STAUR_5361 [Stigmatella aurantiaca DW4/3-1]EAU63285.1 hypothetical protein STIAU_7439 [Stigmatella aurantiaca DW4/3-1]
MPGRHLETRSVFTAVWLAGAGLAGCGPATAQELANAPVGTEEQALTEGAPLTVHDASCLQLQDQNTWSSAASYMTSVGPALGLPAILQDLNRAGPMLTASTHPPATGYKGGFRWNDGDMGTPEWIPQALTAGVSGSANVAIVSWHYALTNPDKGVRISVADISDMSASAVNYRHLLLVRPTSAGNFTNVAEHGGGLAWYGNYLYMADTSDGIRVFDLTQIRAVDTSTACETKLGKNGSVWCAYGYKYVLPQVSAYVMPASITSPCRTKFSFLGKDTRGTVPGVLSGEYCNNGDTPCPYDGSTPGLGGRLYRWPVDAATNRLKAVSGVVKPERAYIMNEPNVQGVAPLMTATSTTSYWLSSTRYGGALFKVSTSASRTAYLSGSSQWPKMPEGMHATGSGTNLWTVTEGVAGVTSPASGGRVVFFVDQASVD